MKVKLGDFARYCGYSHENMRAIVVDDKRVGHVIRFPDDGIVAFIYQEMPVESIKLGDLDNGFQSMDEVVSAIKAAISGMAVVRRNDYIPNYSCVCCERFCMRR